jgi:uncharacterized protein (DUF58 family)
MSRTLYSVLCQIYTLLLLLATVILSEIPRFLPALVLLLILLTFTVRPLHPRYNIAVYAAVIFLTPLFLAPAFENMTSLQPLAIHITAVVMIIPVFFLLDHSLRQNTLRTRLPMKKTEGVYISGTLASLLVLSGIIIFISFVVDNRVLLYTGVAFILYLTGAVFGIVLTIRHSPLSAITTTGRIIAGTSGDMIIDLTNQTSARVHCQFGSHEPWLNVVPLAATLEKGRVKLNVSYKPPLAGNSHPRIQSITKDLRGFVQIYQIFEPIELRIIPRAKYAEWLAYKYLERSGEGMTTAASMQLQAIIKPKGGTDYRESRDYTPGDQLKDIDWKHTLRLSQLIVKDYTNDEESATIIAVNLAVADAEEADKLSYKLVTAALTLARENIPTALAAYNHREVVLCTNITEPDEALKQALLLLREIIPVKTVNRRLEIADITDIKRNINQLTKAKSRPAQRLLSILDFKYRSIEEFTKNHPATIALSSTTEQVPAPATILFISQLNHDAEVIRVISEKLSRRRFTTVPLEFPVAAIPR